MNRRKWFASIAAVGSSIDRRAEAQATDSNRTMDLWNGRAWKEWLIPEKTSWIEGFTSGYAWSTMQAEQILKAAQPNNAQGFESAFKMMRKQDLVEGFTNLQLAREVDRVYSDENNLNLSLDMAVAHALHRLNKQYSETELQDELGRFRALAIFSKTTSEPRK